MPIHACDFVTECSVLGNFDFRTILSWFNDFFKDSYEFKNYFLVIIRVFYK